MALRDALLTALLDGEASGYDLAKDFDASVANFWMATPQQLYRELEKMEADGFVHARVVEQQRRPNKRLFSLTEAGFDALVEFTSRAPKPGVVRDELLVQVQAVDHGDVDAVRAAIEERKSWALAKIARYERLRDRLTGGLAEKAYLETAARVGPYLTLLRGLAFEQENVRWADRALSVLTKRQARASRSH